MIEKIDKVEKIRSLTPNRPIRFEEKYVSVPIIVLRKTSVRMGGAC